MSYKYCLKHIKTCKVTGALAAATEKIQLNVSLSVFKIWGQHKYVFYALWHKKIIPHILVNTRSTPVDLAPTQVASWSHFYENMRFLGDFDEVLAERNFIILQNIRSLQIHFDSRLTSKTHLEYFGQHIVNICWLSIQRCDVCGHPKSQWNSYPGGTMQMKLLEHIHISL